MVSTLVDDSIFRRTFGNDEEKFHKRTFSIAVNVKENNWLSDENDDDTDGRVLWSLFNNNSKTVFNSLTSKSRLTAWRCSRVKPASFAKRKYRKMI